MHRDLWGYCCCLGVSICPSFHVANENEYICVLTLKDVQYSGFFSQESTTIYFWSTCIGRPKAEDGNEPAIDIEMERGLE